MSHYWQQKPENALNRAKELLEANRKETALQVLSNVLIRKNKGAKVWQPELEDVVHLYLEICVGSHDHHMAKDGLHQFRSIAQIAGMQSALEDVIRVFLDKAIKRTAEVLAEVDKVVADHEAAGAEESLESQLIFAVNGYDIRERSEKEMLFPWLKFMWESFRAVLELIKNKAKMEKLYFDTTKLAMEHCIKYNRTTEFRRLNELLRSHLIYLNKYPNNQGNNTISLSSPEAQVFLLETRFELLNAAMRMGVWQEGFKCIEDIHGLIVSTKMVPSTSLMVGYYEQLSKLFWVSKNYLYHAYAQLKFFQLTQQIGTASEETIKELALKVVIGALSVPLRSNAQGKEFEFTSQQEKSVKYASLLGYSSVLKRSTLVKEVSASCLKLVDAELSTTFDLVEHKFQPLQIAALAKPMLDKLGGCEKLGQYQPLLRRVIFMRLMQQLTRIYETIELSKVKELAAPLELGKPIEVVIVELTREGLFDARLNHRTKSICFASRSLEPSMIQNQLRTLTTRLAAAVEMIQPENVAATEEKKSSLVSTVLEHIKDERRGVADRRSMIETEKETQQNIEKLKARLSSLATELRIAKAPKVVPKAEPAAVAQPIVPQTIKPVTLGAAALPPKTPGSIPVEEVKKPEGISKEKQAELDAEKEEALRLKLVELSKRMDYLERARREEEAPLLKAWYEKHREEAQKLFEEEIKQFEARQRQEHALALAEKQRLAKVSSYADEFEKALVDSRRQKFEEELARVEAHNAKNFAIIEEERAKMKKIILERRRAENERRRAREEAEQRRQAEYESMGKRSGAGGSSWADTDDSGDVAPPPSRFGSDRPRFGGRSSSEREDRPRFGGRSSSEREDRPRFGGRTSNDRDDGDRPRFGGRSDREEPREDRNWSRGSRAAPERSSTSDRSSDRSSERAAPRANNTWRDRVAERRQQQAAQKDADGFTQVGRGRRGQPQ
mmetsp:Transcript_19087/g.73446  ORF Transcript_19087/g.73446 Transcript_19087/m.73446 type:complete len:955 (-) Transcript_19087:55-2919(-)